MEELYKKALRLEYFTVTYNIFEALVSLYLGGGTDSIALIGFGLDSIAESLSGLVLIWRLRQHERVSLEKEALMERNASRFVAATFFLLGTYVLLESLNKLVFQEIPSPTIYGIGLASISVTIMPILAQKKENLGLIMGSKALVADSKETLACAALSLALLLGLGSNYLFGFWQADPLVGLIIVMFLFREGMEGWRAGKEEKEETFL